MAAYTGTLNFYDSVGLYIGDSSIDLSDATAGTFKVMLVTSTYTPNENLHTILSDVTNEITAAGSYSRKNLIGATWTEAAGITTFNANNTVFTATGADYDAARYWVLYEDTSTSPLKPLIAYGLIDDTPADVIVTDGTSLTLQWNNLGLFTLGA